VATMHQHTQQAVCAVHHQPGRHGAETLRPLVAVRGTPQSNQTASATVCNTRSLPTMLPSRSHSTASRTDVDQPTAAVQRDCAAVANAHGRPQRAAPLRARRQRSPRMIRRPTITRLILSCFQVRLYFHHFSSLLRGLFSTSYNSIQLSFHVTETRRRRLPGLI
jgi:hypothetical protein